MSSFVKIPEDSDFTLDNLPYGVFSTDEDVSICELSRKSKEQGRRISKAARTSTTLSV